MYGIVSLSLHGYNRECTNLGHELCTMPTSEAGSGSTRGPSSWQHDAGRKKRIKYDLEVRVGYKLLLIDTRN